MTLTLRALMGASAAVCLATAALAQTTITVATVNNGDMIRMQGLMDDFNAKHPDITVEWVTLEENELRQRVTTDIATKGGQFDIITTLSALEMTLAELGYDFEPGSSLAAAERVFMEG